MDTAQQRKIHSYRDLLVWQKSLDLVKLTYDETKGLPRDERYALVAEIRSSARSVPSNIAEGWGRHSRRDYIRFLQIARGSAYELSTQADLCRVLEYCGRWNELIERTEEVGRLLNGLIASIERRDSAATASGPLTPDP